MDSKKIVLHQTAIVALGETLCVAAMIGIFALAGYYDSGVLIGGIAGGALTILNFFLMAVTANMAADKAEAQDVKGGQQLLAASRIFRLLLLAALLFALGKSGICNLLALVIPLVFVQPILTVAEFFRKKGA